MDTTKHGELFDDWEDRYKLLEKKHKQVVSEASAMESNLAKLETIYHRVNDVLAILGADGEICVRHELVEALSDSLFEYDGGTYTPLTEDKA